MSSWHLLHVFSTFNIGGPQVRTSDIIQNLDHRFRHTILAMDGQYLCKGHFDPSKKIDILYSDLILPKKNTLKNVLTITQLLKQIKPNLLLTYNWGAIEWVMAHYFAPVCPIIHAEDGFNHDELKKQKLSRVYIRRLFLRHCNLIIVPSYNLENISKKIWKIPQSKVCYIPNGIEFHKFFCERSEQNLSKSSGQVVGIITALRAVKNIGRLICAFNQLPTPTPHQLWIIGDGEERSKLENIAQYGRNHSQIKFFGKIDDPSLLLKKIHICALSSDSEQMPISILEGMAAGCAILSTDVGDIKNMVSLENQDFVIPLENESSYYYALSHLLENYELCQILGQKNQQKCLSEYTKSQMMEKYQKIYLSLLT